MLHSGFGSLFEDLKNEEYLLSNFIIVVILIEDEGLFQTHNIFINIYGIQADNHIQDTNTEQNESNKFLSPHVCTLVESVGLPGSSKMICQNYILPIVGQVATL